MDDAPPKILIEQESREDDLANLNDSFHEEPKTGSQLEASSEDLLN